MKRTTLKTLTGFAGCTLLLVAMVQGAVVDLEEYAFNIDGTVSNPTWGDPIPAGVNTTLFDDITGLGTISAKITGVGSHYFAGFFDHDIDDVNPGNSFFNEYGWTSGTPGSGQSWEIDEPGYVFGDIYFNFEDSALDNENNVPDTAPEDVSMAMGWDFTLASDEIAVIQLSLSRDQPNSGFYLAHTDPDPPSDGATIYFQGLLSIHAVTTPDLGSSLFLLCISLFGMGCMGKRTRTSRS